MSNILIVDDHKIVREGLQSLLNTTNAFERVDAIGTLDELREVLQNISYHLVIMDLKLNNESGLTGITEIKVSYPETKILILSAFIDQYFFKEAKKNGVEGYLHKRTDFKFLKESIFRILNNETVYDKALKSYQSKPVQDICCQDLTKRQTEIINLLCLGKTNKEIGSALNLSEKTVRNYLSDIFKKINVSNRSEAVGCCIYNQKY